MSTTETSEFKPRLGALDATMIVAGSMIGSGIFIVSADITRNVGSAGWLIVAWLLTGFMTITAPVDMQLVGIASPVADVAEVHEMRMEGDVMRMRAIPALALPAGKAVTLAPGGYHLMLQDLKAPLLAGSTVAVTLQLQDAKGARFEQQVTLPVAMSAPDQGNDKAMQPTGAAHHHHH